MYKQLDLFQAIGEHESIIFQQAKNLKEIVQKYCNGINLTHSQETETIKKDYAILRFQVKIDLISDKENPEEPKTPKVFIWQFIPTIMLDDQIILESGKSYKDSVGPKIIPKWLNLLFTSKKFSQIEFQELTTQYFTLEMILKLLSDKTFVKEEIENKIKERKLIIYFDSKLFPRRSIGFDDVFEIDLINKIRNYYSKLKNIQQENWYLIGNYNDFTEENDLLKELDYNKTIMEDLKGNSKKLNENYTLSDLFQNDYLFLNNNEFFQQKYNTDGWDANCIVPPTILNEQFTYIDEDKLYKRNLTNDSKENDNKRTIYCYLKNKLDGRFIRNEFLFPPISMKDTQLKQILAIAQELLREYGKEQ